MKMVDVVFMMMVVGFVVISMIISAQFEYLWGEEEEEEIFRKSRQQ